MNVYSGLFNGSAQCCIEDMRKSTAGNRRRNPEVSSKWLVHGWGKRLEHTIIKRVTTDSKTRTDWWAEKTY